VVKAINDAAVAEPSVINTSPYEQGWLMDIEVPSASVTESLLGADDYLKLTTS
jgi:glycine cleavage system H protein